MPVEVDLDAEDRQVTDPKSDLELVPVKRTFPTVDDAHVIPTILHRMFLR